VIGKPFWETPWFSATESMPETVRKAFETVLEGREARLEMMLHLPIGDRYFDFAMRPVFDQHGKVAGAVPEAIDITERRQGEEVLRQAQKMEAVGQLTGGVAHDFNNLLTIIRSATDFLRRRELPEERRRRYVDAISETVERASKLTAQLLAFARRQPLKAVVFDVGAQVDNVVQLIRPLVGGRIEISVRIEAGCFTIADVAQFETALINLAINARDAMNDEGRLTISVMQADRLPSLRGQPARSGEFIAICVADTGTGIAPENLDAIFEPFFTTKEVGKGTGLGLSQAFGFARQSGGDIAVKSAPGGGATFTIYLPRASAPAAGGEASAIGREPAATGRGYRVLLVEDNDEVGRFSTELLEDLGYQVKRVASANAALAILAEDEFAADLVFSDVIMPGMNGVELAGVIRERFPGLPVVLTSGYSDVLAANAHHGFELIQKPYSVELLSRILRKAISEQRSAVH
jgi:signal transduction histidine kinase/ActR/RegA family two-component response regulator